MTKAPKLSHTWDRDPHDWYVDPIRCTLQLLDAGEHFPGYTHDPCCGGGNIVKALDHHGYAVTGSDLVQRIEAPWHLGVSDFLGDGCGLFAADNCVFNPPYYRAKGSEACIRKALQLAPGKVAAFVSAAFIWGQERAQGLYADHPPNRIWAITPRPSCPPGTMLAAGGKAEGDTKDYAWLVWNDRETRRQPGAKSDFEWLT